MRGGMPRMSATGRARGTAVGCGTGGRAGKWEGLVEERVGSNRKGLFGGGGDGDAGMGIYYVVVYLCAKALRRVTWL